MKQVFIFGAGGHAKVVLDIIEKQGLYEPIFIVDDNPGLKGKTFFGYRILGGREELLGATESRRAVKCIVGIGDNTNRLIVAHWLAENHYELVRAVHPSVQLARGVSIGVNSVVMAGCVINSDTRIGDSVIINTGATVDHDCTIQDGVHIAPGCHLCGTVTVGRATLLGAGTIVAPGTTIGGNTVVGAGSVITEDIPDEVVAAGHPAKVIKRNAVETSTPNAQSF